MSKSEKIGYCRVGRVIYRVRPGMRVECFRCGRVLLAPELFTRGQYRDLHRPGNRTAPICKTCRPFTIDPKESAALWPEREEPPKVKDDHENVKVRKQSAEELRARVDAMSAEIKSRPPARPETVAEARLPLRTSWDHRVRSGHLTFYYGIAEISDPETGDKIGAIRTGVDCSLWVRPEGWKHDLTFNAADLWRAVTEALGGLTEAEFWASLGIEIGPPGELSVEVSEREPIEEAVEAALREGGE